ncbi:MAG: alpha amylase C-terminal domain-containing protein [Puniceicoccales bacterium]|nr:alpha amylase C-terminal domain-containing protein [Puniceicoccales bacterium]
MGSEFGQYAEWKYDQSLDWHLLEYLDHEGVRRVVRDLNKLYLGATALAAAEQTPEGFEWIEASDGDASVLTFLRRAANDAELWAVACNFTPVERAYRIGVPCSGHWREILNTNATEYGGDGAGNLGGLAAEPTPWNGRPYSIEACLPGQTVVIFRWEKTKTKTKR